jgi:hypothetical protein
MKAARMYKILFSFAIALMMVITSNFTLAQDTSSTNNTPSSGYNNMNNTDGVSTCVQYLKTQLNLNQTQTDSVTVILQDYQSSNGSGYNSNSNMGTKNSSSTKLSKSKVNSRIEAQLDSTQRTKFQNIKSTFWSKVKKSIDTSSSS